MRYRLTHATHYRYDRAITLSPHQFRLYPMPKQELTLHAHALTIAPEPEYLYRRQDVFGSDAAHAYFRDEPTERLDVAVAIDLTIADTNPFSFLLERYAATYPFQYEPTLRQDLLPFLAPVEFGSATQSFLAPYRGWRGGTMQLVLELAQLIVGKVRYAQRFDEGVHPPERTLAEGEGSCRDSAWLMIAGLRELGIAARFVSGYLLQPELEKNQVEYHAWAEAFLPGAGWVGIDATSGFLTAQSHVALSTSSVPERTSSILGRTERCGVELSYGTTLTVV